MSGFLSPFISSPASWPQLWPGYPQSIGPTRCQWWTVSGHVKHSSLSSLSPSHGEHLDQQNHWELKQKCRLWELAAPHYIPFKTVPYQLRVCSVGISVSLTPSWVLLLETGQLIARWRKEGILFGAFHSFPVPEIMLYMAVLMFPFIPRDFVPCFYFLSWIWGAGAES